MNFPYRTVLDSDKDNKLMSKKAKEQRASKIFKNGSPCLVKYLEKKIPVYSLGNQKKEYRTEPPYIATVSASLARVLINTNQVELIISDTHFKNTLISMGK